MIPKKNNKSSDLTFEEEVKEDEIINDSDYKKSNNLSYKRNKKKRMLVSIAFILIVISAILAFIGFVYYDDEVQSVKDKKVQMNDNYKLFVTHSNSYFGGENITFKDYSSEKKAYVYRFDVNNENKIDLNYSIKLKSSNFGKDNINMNLINYSLLKENVQLDFGTLKNSEVVKISDMVIKSNTKDRLTLKIWSENISDNVAFSFRISVDIQGGSHE